MIFVDTSALFALANDRDLKHREARLAFDRLLQAERRLLTHSYVLSESMALLHQRLGRGGAALALAAETRAFDIEWVDEPLHRAAVDRAAQRPSRRQPRRSGELPPSCAGAGSKRPSRSTAISRWPASGCTKPEHLPPGGHRSEDLWAGRAGGRGGGVEALSSGRGRGRAQRPDRGRGTRALGARDSGSTPRCAGSSTGSATRREFPSYRNHPAPQERTDARHRGATAPHDAHRDGPLEAPGGGPHLGHSTPMDPPDAGGDLALPSGSLYVPGGEGDRWTGWARTSVGHFSSARPGVPVALSGQMRMGIFGTTRGAHTDGRGGGAGGAAGGAACRATSCQ